MVCEGEQFLLGPNCFSQPKFTSPTVFSNASPASEVLIISQAIIFHATPPTEDDLYGFYRHFKRQIIDCYDKTKFQVASLFNKHSIVLAAQYILSHALICHGLTRVFL